MRSREYLATSRAIHLLLGMSNQTLNRSGIPAIPHSDPVHPEQNRMKRRIMSVALALLVGAISLAACATAAGEELGTSESEILLPSNCCEGGTYTCNGIDYEIDYWTPQSSCNGPTRPRAQEMCATACGAPCVDTGWEVTCF